MAGLAFLQEAAARSSQLTSGMVGILTSFEERLAKLEKTILPVYNETKYLQQKQESMGLQHCFVCGNLLKSRIKPCFYLGFMCVPSV